MEKRYWLLIIGFFALFFLTIVYWVGVYLNDPVVWLTQFPYVSPVADTWMAGTGLVAALGLIKNRRWGVISGYLSAGACVFIGLTAFHYNLRTGQLFTPSAQQWIEILVPTSLLGLGLMAILLLKGTLRG